MQRVPWIILSVILMGLFVSSRIVAGIIQTDSTGHYPKLVAEIRTLVPQPAESSALASLKTSLAKNSIRPGWVHHCTGKSLNQECKVEHTISLGKNGQRLISVIVRVSPGASQPGLMLHLPVGLYLPAGVTVQLEGQEPEQFRVQTCDLQGCYAGTGVSTSMLSALNSGRHLTVAFQNMSRTRIKVPVPLKGFKGAYEEIQSIG
jgi:invasion protein IalB